MTRILTAALAALMLCAAARAHFVFVVPQKDGKTVQIVFSDNLEPDEAVSIDKIAGLKLTALAGGKASPVACKKGAHCLTAALGATSPETVYGMVAYGVSSRAKPPTLLVYHPKAVIGPQTRSATVGAKADLEAVPVTVGGKTRFRLLARGKAVASAEGSVLLPDGTKVKVKTDKEGYTQEFAASGRYAVWLRLAEKKSGTHDGKKYEAVRHYATLVFDAAKR